MGEFLAQHSPRARVGEALATITIRSAALIVFAAFLWIVFDIVRGGLAHISWSFLTEAPASAGRAGGIGPIIVSTILILMVCLTVAVPLGVSTAVLLSEYTRRDRWFGQWTRWSLDVLAGVPSIVFGLFGNTLFCIVLGLGASILAGGLTLACMVLPILIRTTEQGLRAIPADLRPGAAAMGISRPVMILRVVLPAAVPGLIVGLVLGIGRALAETAALLFTSGYVTRMPGSLLDSGRALSVHIYDLSMNVPGGDANAYASAVVLITLLISINGVASWIAHRWLGRWITT